MAMELQLSTQKAQKALEAVEIRIRATEASLKNFDTAGIEALNRAIGRIAAPPDSVAASISKIGTAVSRLSRATNLTEVANGIMAVGAAAELLAGTDKHITALASALRQIKAPKGLSTAAKGIAAVGNEANMAVRATNSFAAALNNVQTPTGLRGVAAAIRGAGSAGVSASGGIRRFGSELRILGGIGLGVGFWQTYQTLKTIGSTSMAAADDLISFTGKMKASGADAAGVADAFKFVEQTANRLAIPLQGGLRDFSKLSVSMNEVGRSGADTKRVFEGFATAFRAMGLNTEQVNRGFNAVSQIFTKGTVQMEELKQQLGEVAPMFGMLASYMGKVPSELAKMMEQGQVAAGVLVPFADHLKERFEAVAAFMRTTGQAAVTNFTNALFKLATFSGEGLYRGLRDGLEALNAAMDTSAVKAFAAVIGETLGTALGIAAAAVGFFAESFGIAVQILGTVGSVVGTVLQTLAGFVPFISGIADSFTGLSGTLLGIGPYILGAAIAFGTLWAAFKVGTIAVGLLNVALGILATTTGLMVLKVVALGTTMVAFAAGLAAVYLRITEGGTIMGHWADIMAQTGDAITGAAQSLGGFVQEGLAAQTPLLNLQKTADILGVSVEELGSAAGIATGPVGDVGDAAEKAGGGLKKGASAATEMATTLPLLSNAADSARGSFGQLGRSADGLSSDMLGAGNSADDFGFGLSGVSSSASSTIGALNGSASAANSLAGSYSNAASAADRLASSAERAASATAKVKVTGGGGGGTPSRGPSADLGEGVIGKGDFSTSNSSFDFGDSSFFNRRGGGRATDPAPTQRAPLSAFTNAPKLAGGIDNTNALSASLPGGGIPTILHPNEAVVPLAGGGSIPVSMSVPQAGGGSSEVLDELHDQTKILGRLYSVADATLPGIFKAATFRPLTGGGSSSGGSVSLSGGSSLFGGGSSSSGSASSSGTSLAGAASSGDGTADFSNVLRGLDNSISTPAQQAAEEEPYAVKYAGLIQSLADLQSRAGSIRAEMAHMWEYQTIYYGTKGSRSPRAFTTRQAELQYTQMGLELDKISGDINRLYASNPEFAKAAQKEADKAKKQRSTGSTLAIGSGFADGSPNASKDVRSGGFQATLHPDEAVIPLPDGRSVPVELPRALQRKINGGDDTRATSSGAQRPVTINMTVQTPDGDSFRKSKDQILNDLRAGLARGSERSGPPGRKVEDPTLRTTKVS